MAAIGLYLPVNLITYHARRHLLPLYRSRKKRKQDTQSVQRDGFSEQVRVGREIVREIRFEMQAVMVEFFQKPPAKGRVELVSNEVKDPHPGQSTKCDFQSAGPVDASLERILLKPAFELAWNFVEEIAASGKQMSLSQQDQVLVPIDLPDRLVVAGAVAVEVGNVPEVSGWRFDAARVVLPPADCGPRFERQAEQREPML